MRPHISGMQNQSSERLAIAISALIAQFKVGPEGAAYDDLSLTDTALIACLAQAASAGREPIQKEVGDALGLPKTTMTSAVKRLGHRGLVQQSSGTNDARAKILRLTPAGENLGSKLKSAQIAASKAILHNLTARNQTRLVELLETAVANLPPKQSSNQK